jgi:Flp pilus assembly protein TadG
MSRLAARIRSDSGQALVLVAVSMAALVGMAALVIDGGSWWRTQRQLQTAADAAALAGAQQLPDQPSARTTAIDLAGRNYSGLAAPAVTFPGSNGDKIDVVATTSAPGILARIYGSAFNTVSVRAHAQAQVQVPTSLKDVAPIAVPMDTACVMSSSSCFGQTVTLDFEQVSASDPTKSKFGFLNLDRTGNPNTSQLSTWISKGYDSYLPLNTFYPVANGDKNGFKNALTDAIVAHRPPNTPLLFPVYDVANSSGYHVIGWSAFVIDSMVKWNGSGHVLTGHFVTFLATDLAGSSGTLSGSGTDFGLYLVSLTQ